jgi:anaerobic selenocysteine-containing dehydrogenase
LQPQLPGLLRTEGQRINLAPSIICDDEPRLAASVEKVDPDRPLLMIGRRNIRDMNSWLHNINQYVRGKNRCTLMIHPDDAKARNLNHGDSVKIEARIRTHEVELCISDEMMPGVVSLPHGFGHVYTDTQQSVASDKLPGVSANDLVDDEVLDMPSGAGVANGVPVQVSAL